MKKLSLLLMMGSFVLQTACVYEDFDKPTPTETFSDDKKVLFIGIDGLRYDLVTQEYMPNIWELIETENTAWTTSGRNEYITLSGPNWTTLLTGVHYNKHNVRDNLFVDPRLERWPSIFHTLESTYINFETASIVHWEPINDIIVRNCTDIDIRGNDQEVEDATVDLLTYNYEADLVFVHLDDVDAAGHSAGFSPEIPTYVNAVQTVDERVGNILEALFSRTTFVAEDWLVIITTDHGGEGVGHYGGGNPNIRRVFQLLHGPSVVVDGQLEFNPDHVDLPVTALKHLGIGPLEDVDGSVIAIE